MLESAEIRQPQPVNNAEGKSPMKKFSLAAIILSLVITSQTSATEALATKVLRGATVVELNGGAPIKDAVVLIEGDKIVAIGSPTDVSIPSEAEIIDVTGTWLIPGLMNMHVHLGLVLPGNMSAELANETEGELTLAHGPGRQGKPASRGHHDSVARRTTTRGPRP